MSKLKVAVLFSVVGQYSLQIVNFVSAVILARLLVPEQLGLFSVVVGVAFLAIEIRAIGVSEYLIREHEIDRAKLQAVLGVMMIMSWGLFVVLAVAAPFIARFYGVTDLRDLLWIIIIPFLVAPFASVPYALMAREMNFQNILKVDLIGVLCRSGIQIGMVLLGYGYYGLAWGSCVGTLAEFLVIVWYRPAVCGWIPSFRGARAIVRAGVQISAGRFLNTTAQNAGDMILGKMMSMRSVGLFSRGMGLILYIQSLLVSAVSPVVLPHLAEVRRSGGSLSEAYLKSVSLVGVFTLPVFAVVTLAAHSMINALFGDQWQESVQVAAVLAMWAMLQSVHCYASPALLAMGKERLVLVKELVSFVAKIVLIVVAVPFGLEAVAWATFLSGVVDVLVATVLMRLACDITLTRLVRCHAPNIAIAAVCWLVLWLLGQYVDFKAMNDWLALVLMGAVLVPVWVFMIKLTRHQAWLLVSERFEILRTRWAS